MSAKFCKKFETNPLERFQLAEMLYYRLLTNILIKEMKEKTNFDVRVLNLETFQAALIANSLEIVIFAYRSPQKFPFVLNCFNMDAFLFYKTIEVIVSNHGELLSNDVIKHLSAVSCTSSKIGFFFVSKFVDDSSPSFRSRSNASANCRGKAIQNCGMKLICAARRYPASSWLICTYRRTNRHAKPFPNNCLWTTIQRPSRRHPSMEHQRAIGNHFYCSLGNFIASRICAS